MATIKISHTHNLPHDEVKSRVSELFEAYQARFGIKTRWEGDTLHLNGTGFEGKAQLVGPRVDIEVKLGLVVSAFKGQVESGLKSELDKRLKATTAQA